MVLRNVGLVSTDYAVSDKIVLFMNHYCSVSLCFPGQAFEYSVRRIRCFLGYSMLSTFLYAED
jgi:hypothetical protein